MGMTTSASDQSGGTGSAATPPDPRLFAPATQRNRQPILDALSLVLPNDGLVLEVASGSGEHAVWFAQQLRPLVWQPSDPDPLMRQSIAAHAAGAGIKTLMPPLDLDVTGTPWPIERADGVVCINMIHIAPWAAAEGLMRGAGAILRAGGVLCLYGPFKRGGQHTAPSNASFDQSLRAENPSWGVRDLEAVADLGAPQGLLLDQIVEMPANNLTLVFKRKA